MVSCRVTRVSLTRVELIILVCTKITSGMVKVDLCMKQDRLKKECIKMVS